MMVTKIRKYLKTVKLRLFKMLLSFSGVHPLTSITAGELQKQDKKQTKKV